MLLNFLCERNNFLFLCFNTKADSQFLFNHVIENCGLNVWNVRCVRPFPGDVLVGLREPHFRKRVLPRSLSPHLQGSTGFAGDRFSQGLCPALGTQKKGCEAPSSRRIEGADR